MDGERAFALPPWRVRRPAQIRVSTTPAIWISSALSPLTARTSGRPQISIGLIDGPVALDHPDLATENIREVPGNWRLCTPMPATQHARMVHLSRDPFREADVRGFDRVRSNLLSRKSRQAGRASRWRLLEAR